MRILLSIIAYGTNFYGAEMHKHRQPCTELIEVTVNELSDDIVAVMLLALQKDNLQANVRQAVQW